MTHWFREPKRIKLMEHLQRPGIDFVLCSEGFPEGDLRNLQASPQQVSLAERLRPRPPKVGDDRKVLIAARPGGTDPDWLRNPEPWEGVTNLPAFRLHRGHALQSLLTLNRAFHNGARGKRVMGKGVLNRFALDMRTQTPALSSVRETHARSK
jgi:hypothetical protein